MSKKKLEIIFSLLEELGYDCVGSSGSTFYYSPAASYAQEFNLGNIDISIFDKNECGLHDAPGVYTYDNIIEFLGDIKNRVDRPQLDRKKLVKRAKEFVVHMFSDEELELIFRE